MDTVAFLGGRSVGICGTTGALEGGTFPGNGGIRGADEGILSVLLSLTDFNFGIPPANKLPN